MKQPNLSASSVKVFEECPLCFWLEKTQNIARPKGIFPSLPGGVDRKLKAYYDEHRMARTKPIEIQDPALAGFELYADLAKMTAWRNWRSGLKVQGKKWTLIGAIDDLLYNPDTEVCAPLDFKTKGSETNREDVVKYYERQLDFYALLLQESGLIVSDFGVIVSYCPHKFFPEQTGALLQFDFQTFKIDTDTIRARSLLDAAADCLQDPNPPGPAADCGYCMHAEAREARHASMVGRK